MDLWVRTQGKKVLVKIDTGLTIRKLFLRDDEVFVVEKIEPSTINKGLGQYKSEKRALEVLDKIQELMKKEHENLYAKKITKDINGDEIMYFKEEISPNCVVYEMPKE